MTALIQLEDLAIRTQERFLVDGVSMTVQPRRVTALIGPSGAGKSLTARAAMGVLDVEPGLVRGHLRYPVIDPDRDWLEPVRGQGMRAQRTLLAQTRHLRGAYFTYSPQAASSALNPGRTVGRQLELAIARREDAPEDLGAEIAKILAEVGMGPEVARSLPGALSGGMAQRAALAIAIARWHTRLKALSRSSAPAACSAAISPRECPAAKSAWRPALFMMSKAPTETATVAGCAWSVFCSRSSCLGSASLSYAARG